MAVFQNSSLYSLSIMINGVRRNIRPGEQISGPDSLAAVVGLTIINPSTKTIIPKENIIQPQTINNIASKNNYRPEIIPKFLISENSKSNFKPNIYLLKLKNWSRIGTIILCVLGAIATIVEAPSALASLRVTSYNYQRTMFPLILSVYILALVFYCVPIYFFTRPKVKEQFK